MKSYIILVEVENQEERWPKELSENREDAIKEATLIVDNIMKSRGITNYRFVNIISAD